MRICGVRFESEPPRLFADVLPLRAALPAQGDEMQRLRRRGIVPDDLAYGLPGPPGETLQYRGADRRISDTKILHGGAHGMYSRAYLREMMCGAVECRAREV